MLLLFETPAGYSLFKIKDERNIDDAEVRVPARSPPEPRFHVKNAPSLAAADVKENLRSNIIIGTSCAHRSFVSALALATRAP
jgi:hypothetical protein|mmetsp:Transcript_10186/g.36903  ORF Transcript_10186/g.36903 Transcript_10186/m.36903 type:complete len:83 (+) Transcript_10186:294-542(+)